VLISASVGLNYPILKQVRMNRVYELSAANLITKEQKKSIEHLVLEGKIMPNSFVNFPDNENLLSVLVSFLEDHPMTGK